VGVEFNGSGSTLNNSSTIGGGSGGIGGSGSQPTGAVVGGIVGDGAGGQGGVGGAGGVGVEFTATGATFNNSGTVAGGNGGNGGNGGATAIGGVGIVPSGNGGNGGAGVAFTATGGHLTNSGIIDGGYAGVGAVNGVGGVGVVGTGLAIVDSGAISGGASGPPLEGLGGLVGGVGTPGDAIMFTGGTNSLTLENGYAITGYVVAYSAADALALGGSANSSFNVSQIGPQYQGFGVYEKTGSSTWNLTGSTTTVTSWQIDNGALAVICDANLGNASGSLTFGGGALVFLSGGPSPFTSSRAITLQSGGGIFDTFSNSATLNGPISGPGALTKSGQDTLTLTQTNTYTGGTYLNQGTLALDALGAAGTNSILFGADNETLQVANAALPANHLANALNDFGGADVIDLTGLGYHSGATATYNSHTDVLTVTSNGVSDTLTLLNAGGTSFVASSDGSTGTDIRLMIAPSPV
jgi:autotransporter-associated beta strand protein